MNRIFPRSLAPLLAAAALPFTPATAQEVALPQVNAPPPAAPAPAPVAQVAPTTTFAAPKPVVQAAPPPGPQAEDLARQAQADAAVRQSARRTPANVRAAVPARTASTAVPVATAAAAPVAVATAAPATTLAPTDTPLVAAPAPTAPIAAQQTTTTTTRSGFNWLWAVLGVGVLAALGALLFLRRRRDEEVVYDDSAYVEEPVYTPPVAVAAPVHEPEVPAAATSRPQIEIGIRPIRAGSDNGQARVDYEVIVENAGALDAHNVTVTSWLLDGTKSSDAEAALIEPTTSQVDVAAGEATSVPASAVVDSPRGAFRPIVAAGARYTLPDGTEGHIAARFAVGVDGGEPGRITPIVLDRNELREDLGVRLEGEVERV